MHKISAYMALFRKDGTEPPLESGYTRAEVGEVDIWDIMKVPSRGQIIFPEITDPGCGMITGYALYNKPEDGDPLYIWMLPEPVDCHKGTIPFIHQGKLLLGVDVSAQIILNSAENAAVSK